MTFEEKIKKAKDMGVSLPSDIEKGNNIVGVYGFFAVDTNSEFCFYIGKATNLLGRLLNSNGHVSQYIMGNTEKYVPSKIKEYYEQGYSIVVKILSKVNYYDTSYSRAAHRLAYAEIKQIVKYQKKGQCLLQKPEGSSQHTKNFWEKNYNLKNK